MPPDCRYHFLDNLRGFACLIIVIYHAFHYWCCPINGGNMVVSTGLSTTLLGVIQYLWIGVPIFFVISGYCITASAERYRHPGRSAGSFFKRRFYRIYPPYLIALSLTICLVIIDRATKSNLLPESRFPLLSNISLASWLGNLTLTESWRGHIFSGEGGLILPISWTLCYEEQFYIVTGCLALLFPRRMFAALAVVTIIVFFNSVGLNIRPIRDLGMDLSYFQIRAHGTFLKNHWLDFAVGCLVFWRVVNPSKKRRFFAEGILLLSIPLVVRGLINPHGPNHTHYLLSHLVLNQANA